jgi:hypothetical protein
MVHLDFVEMPLEIGLPLVMTVMGFCGSTSLSLDVSR